MQNDRSSQIKELIRTTCYKVRMTMPSAPIIKSLVRFGIVGILAGLTQATLFFVLEKYTGLSGLVANAFAFVFALLISYFGQSRWTFADRENRSIPRFITIGLVSLVVGSGGAWIIVDRWRFSPIWMLPVILFIIPAASFLLMRAWAFTR